MHIFFGLILIVFFIGALCVFCVHGLRRVRREQMLATQACDMGLKFSRLDPFDLPVKYAGFSLMCCGHGQNAYNVAYGRMEHFDVQAFDFSYETGHGFERTTRRYGVIVFTLQTKGDVLMWSQYKPEHMPFMIGTVTGSVGPWFYCGSHELAECIHGGDSNDSLEKSGACVELKNNVLMVSMPYNDERKWNYSLWLQKVFETAKTLPKSQEEENISFQIS